MQPCLVVSQWIQPEVHEMLIHSFRVVPNTTRKPLTREELLRRSRDSDALMIFGPDMVDLDFVKACPHLKIIAATIEDRGHVDVEACTQHGIWYTAVHPESLSPCLVPTTDKERAGVLDAAACIFEALVGETPKGAINFPSKQGFRLAHPQP